MRARAILSSYLPRSLALSRFPTKSFISPTCEITVRNFFVSPTYAKTGGCTPPKNVGAPTFALSFLPIPTLGSLSFQLLAHSFIFRITRIPYPSSTFRTLCRKTGGTPNSGHTNASALSFVKKPLLCVPAQRTLSLCGESLFSLPATSHFLPLPFTIHFRGHTNVTAAGGRSVLQRCFSLRGAAASIAASNGCAWSKGRERRKRSARRAWAYFS